MHWADTHPGRHPLGRHRLGRHPLGRNTPLVDTRQSRHPPSDGTHHTGMHSCSFPIFVQISLTLTRQKSWIFNHWSRFVCDLDIYNCIYKELSSRHTLRLMLIENFSFSNFCPEKKTQLINQKPTRHIEVKVEITVADPMGGCEGRVPPPPPGGSNSFNFMQFLVKFGKIVCWCPWRVGTPTLGKYWIHHWIRFGFSIVSVLEKYIVKTEISSLFTPAVSGRVCSQIPRPRWWFLKPIIGLFSPSQSWPCLINLRCYWNLRQ